MVIKLSIAESRQIGNGIWEARLDPVELRLISPGARAHAGPSVLLLADEPVINPGGALEANLASITVLNVGTTERLLLVRSDDVRKATDSTAREERLDPPTASGPPVAAMIRRSGDQEFLDATPPHLKPLAERLLHGVRRAFPGELVYKSGSGRFVETPDNWWTVKPQPVARSFRFTVRARVRELENLKLPKLTRDRNDSYAAFIMDNEKQLPAILEGLHRAAQNRRM